MLVDCSEVIFKTILMFLLLTGNCQKKNVYLTARLTISVASPPPLVGGDFNTVNINCTWYSLATRMILNHMICGDHVTQYTPCPLGSVLGNTALETLFLDTLPGANIEHILVRKTLKMLQE